MTAVLSWTAEGAAAPLQPVSSTGAGTSPEIALLHSHRRINLGLPLREWLEGAVAPEWVKREGISPAIAADVTALPADVPDDPADRIIVATARVLGATLLTRDTAIIESAVVPTVG